MDVLDRVPRQAQMASNVLDCHGPQKVQGKSLHLAGVGHSGVSKAKIGRPNDLALLTEDTLNPGLNEDRLVANGKSPELADLRTPANDVLPPAFRAAHRLIFGLDTEDHGTPFIPGGSVVVADQTPSVIQDARGHVWPPGQIVASNLQVA